MRGVGAVLMLIALPACAPDVTELQRQPSPDGRVECVQAVREVDATVATPTEFYLLPKGRPVHGDPVFRADKVENISCAWNGNSELLVHAAEARVFVHQVRVTVETPGVGPRTIQVRLDIAKQL